MQIFALIFMLLIATGLGYLILSLLNDISDNSIKKFFFAMIIGAVVIVVVYASFKYFPATEQRPF